MVPTTRVELRSWCYRRDAAALKGPAFWFLKLRGAVLLAVLCFVLLMEGGGAIFRRRSSSAPAHSHYYVFIKMQIHRLTSFNITKSANRKSKGLIERKSISHDDDRGFVPYIVDCPG